MRGYYYDQTGRPRSTPAPISAGAMRQWSGAAAVLLFLLTMALLGLTAAAGLWSHSRLEELPGPQPTHLAALSRSGGAAGGNHSRAGPTGDGTTLTISPCPAAGPTPQEIYQENIASIVSIRGARGRHEPGHWRGDVGGRVYHHQQPRH